MTTRDPWAGASPATTKAVRPVAGWRWSNNVIVPAVVVIVALAVGYGVMTLRGHADGQRQGETLLARVESLSTRQGTIQWQAIGEQELSDELQAQVEDVRARLTTLFIDLAAVSPESGTILTLQRAVEDYERAVDAILRQLAVGELDEAREALETRAEPAYVALVGLIEEESLQYQLRASSISERADLGSALALGSAVVLVLLLYRRFDRTRRAAMVEIAEERVLRQAEARFRSLVQHSSDTITVVDATGTIRFQSPSVERLLGYEADELVGHSILDLAHPDDTVAVRSMLDALRPGTETRAVEWRIQHRDGEWLHVESRVTDLSEDRTVGGFVLNTRDVTERKALEERLAHRAFYDSLTELPNRALFRDRLEQSVASLHRNGGRIAVMFLDLDSFKSVNDTLGHAVGDELLVAVASRLRSCVRPTDTVARLAGDEFAVLLPVVNGPEDAAAAARRIVDALAAPVPLRDQEFVPSASIGIALSTGSSSTGEDLLRNADLAMYTAKANGKGRYEIFDAQMHRDLVERIEFDASLRRAIERDELWLAFQPIVSLSDGAVVSVEALARWTSPTLGRVEPGVFIPAAEASGDIVEIGRWVLEHACAEAVRWSGLARGDTPSVAVNTSNRELHEPDFIPRLRDILHRTGLPPQRLVLEITESVMVEDIDTTTRILAEIRGLGVRIAMDDFGAGYSSLGLVHRLPLDILKFDRVFLLDGASASFRGDLIGSILALGRSLGIRTVAEGIETPAQLERLRTLGCDLGQGYLLQAPLDALTLHDLLAVGHVAQVPPAATPARLRPAEGLG